MIRRSILAGLAAALMLGSCDKPAPPAKPAITTINFSILDAEDQQSMRGYWQGVMDDLAKATGLTVKPFFGSNYSALVEAMRFNQVQAGWFSALPALEAVRRGQGRVVSRVVLQNGQSSYRSVIITRKASHLTVDKIMRCDKTLDFGMGDPKSTSGTLAPLTYLFAPRGIDPADCFKTVRSANHQANFLAVANGLLDAATNNTVGQMFYKRSYPEALAKTEIVWSSPDLPEAGIVVRQDLDPVIAKKIADFFVGYGKAAGAEGERQRKNLEKLEYSGFQAADDGYLLPVRQMEAGENLRQARKSGDKARIAAAQQAFDALQKPANPASAPAASTP